MLPGDSTEPPRHDPTSARPAAASLTASGNRQRLLATLAAGLLVALGIVIYVHTGEGELELTVNEPNATVRIDGELQTITVESPQGKLSITVPTGKHRLEVSKDGFTGCTHEFRVTRNGTTVISAVLAR